MSRNSYSSLPRDRRRFASPSPRPLGVRRSQLSVAGDTDFDVLEDSTRSFGSLSFRRTALGNGFTGVRSLSGTFQRERSLPNLNREASRPLLEEERVPRDYSATRMSRYDTAFSVSGVGFSSPSSPSVESTISDFARLSERHSAAPVLKRDDSDTALKERSYSMTSTRDMPRIRTIELISTIPSRVGGIINPRSSYSGRLLARRAWDEKADSPTATSSDATSSFLRSATMSTTTTTTSRSKSSRNVHFDLSVTRYEYNPDEPISVNGVSG